MPYREILLEAQDPLAWITLNNPKKINALSIRMVSEVTDALNRCSEMDTVKVIIIRAEGKHFCAGHDLKEMVGRGTRDNQALFDGCTAMMQRIHEVPLPVIAQVQGVATAAGCQLVAACDIAVAETDARFATPGVRIGLFCSTPAVAISRAIGRKAAMEMLLTGRYVSATEAVALGLINRVVPPKELAETTESLASDIACASRFVLGLGKQTFYAQVDQADHTAYQMAGRAMTANLSAEDAQHGIRSFLDKSVPQWKNR